jgi:hypothetical protein
MIIVFQTTASSYLIANYFTSDSPESSSRSIFTKLELGDTILLVVFAAAQCGSIKNILPLCPLGWVSQQLVRAECVRGKHSGH